MTEGECMFTAARKGNRDLLRTQLLHRSVEEVSDRGRTPLHEAAQAGKAGCVREILSMAAASGVFIEYVDRRAKNGQTALFMAAAEGHTDIVKLLLTAGADINARDAAGSTPLLTVVSKGHPSTAVALIRKGADVNHTDASQQSCLHLASARGSSQVVYMLLRFCALNMRNAEQKTAIYLAAENSHHECLDMLATAGADVELWALDHSTPLAAAVAAQSELCVATLLRHGADPDAECALWPQLPLHVAAGLGNVNILRRLAAVTARGPGSSALFEAVGQPEMLKVLLEAGFTPDATPCEDVYDVGSPLGLVLSSMADETQPDSESMSLLMRAGARLTEECWQQSLCSPLVLEPLLAQRCKDQGEGPGARPLLSAAELEALVDVATEDPTEAGSWLPALLESGLDPNALLVPDFLMDAPGDVLTYLLEMVDWSRLSRPLRDVLEQRQKMGTWEPPAHLEGVPPLFHLCRLWLRSHLGPDVLMRSKVVTQLPVPLLLHDHLLFADVKAPRDTCLGSPFD